MKIVDFLPGVALLLLSAGAIVDGQLIETERVEEYHKRGYTWPPKAVVPNTTGWYDIMTRRIKQIEAIPKNEGKYDAFMSTVAMAIFPNYTENGWALTRAPDHIIQALKDSLHMNMATAKPESRAAGRTAIESAENVNDWEPPIFIQQWELNGKVLRDLKPMHEEWAGIPLVGEVAYGLRVYKNNSMLHMHVDKMRTHIISSILHVDHDDDPDSEPWPIYIEDFQGNVNEVVLESGDMLFYESSKCMHGRPKPFKGKWYSSIFTHYYPRDNWDKQQRELENHYAIPPSWTVHKPLSRNSPLPQITMAATAYTEPSCEHWWCGIQNTVKWRGPAKKGVVISAGDRSQSDEEKEEL